MIYLRLWLSCCVFLLVFLAAEATGQQSQTIPDWIHEMYKDDADIGLVLDMFDSYYKTHEFQKNEHTQYLKRWIHAVSRDQKGVYNPRLTAKEREEINESHIRYMTAARSHSRQSTAGWVGIGPFDWDHEAASKSYAPGAAHIYTVEQAPSNDDILYAGTATAGLWKSTDHGMSWSCLTMDIMENSVYAIDIHPTDPDIVLTDLLDNVYKTTDGGQTWLPTGDAGFQGLSMAVLDILFHRNDGDLAFAATDEGLFRTDDQGSTWSEVISNKVQEIQIHPTNDSIFYAVEQVGDVTKFYRSEDMGLTFLQQTNGWPTPADPDHNRRAEIAVSPDAPDKVVALLTGSVNGGSGLYGIYISNDQGTTWTFSCCGPHPGGLPDLDTVPPNINMMAWSDIGSDNGGQYYYDLALAVSPTNADTIFVGGVNMWVSGDGGTTFTCPSKWSHSSKVNYVHADIHDINYFDNGELWIACDGGIFYSEDNGAHIDRRMTGIQGSDLWGYGVSFWGGGVMLGGAYHNGTLIKNDSAYINGWHCIDGGDGTGGFANVGREKRVYSNYNVKDLPNDRLTPIPTRNYAAKPYTHYVIGRSSNIAFHPDNYSIQYFGKDTMLYMTTDDHYSATVVHHFNEAVADVEVSMVNPDYIYVATFPSHWSEKKIYRTSDGGATWTDITPPTSVFSANRWLPYDLSLGDEDPNVVYMARVANSVASYDGQKVYKSNDGGLTWINLTTAVLDGEQLTNIVYQRGTDEGLWIGTRRTVYYKSNNLSDWSLCNTDLPLSTFSTKLIINYRTQKIRNGTNRSAHELPLIEPSVPKAQLSVDRHYGGCSRDTFYFSDYTGVSENGVSWDWSFPGATFVNSTTIRNPKVLYATSGNYDVSLIVADVNGSDTMTKNNFISVENLCATDTFPGNSLRCNIAGDYAISSNNIQTTQLTVTAWVKPDAIQPNYTGIFMGSGTTAGFNFKDGNNTLGYHWPAGEWWWSSNHQVPVDEWSYVAMVASPEGMTLYLNGVGHTHPIALDTAMIDAAYLGSYLGWNSRNYTGELDEVTVWNRALSELEIRELMYITRDDQINGVAPDPNLIAYYQFNEDTGSIAYDRANLYHATLLNGADRNISTAPIAGGSASTQTIASTGSYVFPNEHVTLAFNEPTGLPNGPVVVSKLNWPPHQLPVFNSNTNKYWVVHSFGTTNELIIDSLFIYDENLGSNICDDNFIFNREFNAEGITWGEPIRPAEDCAGDWIYFPLDTYAFASQYTIGDYAGNFYVDKISPGGNGVSWETAFQKLHPAVHLAGQLDTIFMAEGTYYPRTYARDCIGCSNQRKHTFHPRSGVTILGGFPSSGGNLNGRDWQLYPTVLSGFVSEDPALKPYHILYVDSNAVDITVDGLFIKDGLANGVTSKDKNGSALFCQGGISLLNIEISDHVADSSIVQLLGPSTDVWMKNCLMENNSSGSLWLNVDEGAKLLMDEETEIKD